MHAWSMNNIMGSTTRQLHCRRRSSSAGRGYNGSGIGLRKGSWTKEEDMLLKKCIGKYGQGNWRQVPLRAGLRRCRKSCRLRWLNYLSPNIKRGKFSSDEKDLIFRLHKLLGNKWSLIAGRLPGRTANDIKNYWNSHLTKKSFSSSSSSMAAPLIRHDQLQLAAAAAAADPYKSSSDHLQDHHHHVVHKPTARRVQLVTINNSYNIGLCMIRPSNISTAAATTTGAGAAAAADQINYDYDDDDDDDNQFNCSDQPDNYSPKQLQASIKYYSVNSASTSCIISDQRQVQAAVLNVGSNSKHHDEYPIISQDDDQPNNNNNNNNNNNYSCLISQHDDQYYSCLASTDQHQQQQILDMSSSTDHDHLQVINTSINASYMDHDQQRLENNNICYDHHEYNWEEELLLDVELMINSLIDLDN